MVPPDDRDHILRRRAFYVGSALSLAGCTPAAQEPATPRTEPAPVAVAAEPEPTSAAAPASPPPRAETPAPTGGPPPTDIPEGVPDKIRSMYESLYRHAARGQKEIARVAGTIPTCTIGSPGCDAAWKKFAAEQLVLKDVASSPDGPCDTAVTPEGKVYEKRRNAHVAYLDSLTARLEADVVSLVSGTPGGPKRWEAYKEQARLANPEPCLNFACPEY